MFLMQQIGNTIALPRKALQSTVVVTTSHSGSRAEEDWMTSRTRRHPQPCPHARLASRSSHDLIFTVCSSSSTGQHHRNRHHHHHHVHNEALRQFR